MDEKLMAAPLDEKETYTKKIIKDSFEKYGKDNALAFSGGKDSTTMLSLVRQTFNGKIPWKVFTLDTSAEFPEITEFIHKMAKEWDFELITLKNEEALKTITVAKDKAECCYNLKAVPINTAIKNYGLKALMTAVRWDEQADRINEQFYTERDNPPHMRIQPILHFREADIWAYIKKYNLPFCDLYKKGYRSIDCIPCTGKHGAEGPERGGRDQDKEEAMKRLRSMGYF